MTAYNIGDPETIIFAASEQEALAIFRSICPEDEEYQEVNEIVEGETEITLKWTREFDPVDHFDNVIPVFDRVQTLDAWEKDLGSGIFAFYVETVGWHKGW